MVIGSAAFPVPSGGIAEVDDADAGVQEMLERGVLVRFTVPSPAPNPEPPPTPAEVEARFNRLAEQLAALQSAQGQNDSRQDNAIANAATSSDLAGERQERGEADAAHDRNITENAKQLAALAQELENIRQVYAPKSLKMNLIVHRGFINHFPENTLFAMQKAMDNGADELECDVQLTADNIPVLYHDGTLSRLIANAPEGKTSIRQLTLQEVKQLRFKSLQNSVFADEPIPEFGAFLQYAKSKGVVVYPEIKPGLQPEETTPIIQAVINAGMEHLTVFQSFNMPSLRKVRELTQIAAVGFLTGSANVDAVLNELATMGRAYLLIQYATVLTNPSIVGKCREKGVNLGVWTCNNQTDAIKLMSLGVTNIMSDVDLKGIYS